MNSDVLQTVRKRIGEKNLSTSCNSEGCKGSLEGITSKRILVDADLAFPAHNMTGRRCDYLLFLVDEAQECYFSVPIELKRGGVDASEVSDQLQQGTKFVERIEFKEFPTTCRPVLIYGGKMHENQRKTLNRFKVRFRGHKVTIQIGRCNRPRNVATALN